LKKKRETYLEHQSAPAVPHSSFTGSRRNKKRVLTLSLRVLQPFPTGSLRERRRAAVSRDFYGGRFVVDDRQFRSVVVHVLVARSQTCNLEKEKSLLLSIRVRQPFPTGSLRKCKRVVVSPDFYRGGFVVDNGQSSNVRV
jgi:hypothetical protein